MGDWAGCLVLGAGVDEHFSEVPAIDPFPTNRTLDEVPPVFIVRPVVVVVLHHADFLAAFFAAFLAAAFFAAGFFASGPFMVFPPARLFSR